MSRNGYLAASELRSIGNGLELANAAAASFLDMRDVAALAGVNIHSTAIASAYRSRWMQEDMRKRPWLYGIAPGIVPGLPSGHGDGNCRDVPFGSPNNWMIANAHRWGWSRPLSFDPNHWRHNGSTLSGSTGEQITLEEEDMNPAQAQSLADVQKTVVNIEAILATELNAGKRRGLKGAIESIPELVRSAVWGQAIRRTEGNVAALQELANIRTTQLQQSQLSEIDLGRLADEIVKRLPAGSSDSAAILSALESATASINANIDDQPTEFTVQPK